MDVKDMICYFFSLITQHTILMEVPSSFC